MAHSFKTASPDRYTLLKDFADRMKKYPTEAEAYLWTFIRACLLGVRFRRQYIIGDYIADFACLEKDLVIEVDGEYHFEEEQLINDSQRENWFQRAGFHVLRFTNQEVMENIENVLETIKQNIEDYEQEP